MEEDTNNTNNTDQPSNQYQPPNNDAPTYSEPGQNFEQPVDNYNQAPMANDQRNMGQPAYGQQNMSQPAYGQQNYPHPGNFPQKKKSKLPWILLGIAIVLFLLLAGCITAAYFIGSNLETENEDIQLATNSFLADSTNRNYSAAYRSLCDEDRQDKSEEQWTEAASAQNIEGYEITLAVSILDTIGVANIDMEIDGESISQSFGLAKEDGIWKVCNSDSGAIDQYPFNN